MLDKLGDERDVDWLYDTIKDTAPVVFYHQYYLGHASFAIAKDMSWFEVDVVYLLKEYATNDAATETIFQWFHHSLWLLHLDFSNI